MNILVISGFLGVGKTTWIREMIRRTGKFVAIYENEYAAQGMDRQILEHALRAEPSGTEVNIWERTEGCICCSAQGDFASSVLTIANTVNPEVLLVEPTGVAQLGNILENLKQIQYEAIRILKPVTIVDGLHARLQEQQYPELFRDQILHAGTLIFSKTEQMDDAERVALEDWVRTLGVEVSCLSRPYAEMDDDWWEALTEEEDERAGRAGRAATEIAPDALPDTISFHKVTLPSVATLGAVLERVMTGAYGEIVRAKGIVSCGGEMVQFDLVEGAYTIVGLEPNAIEESGERSAVFIGHALSIPRLKEALYGVQKKRRRISLRRG